MSNRDKRLEYYLYQTNTSGCTPEQIQAIKAMDAKDNATNHRETRYMDDNSDIDDDHNQVALELALSRMKESPEDLIWEHRKALLPDAIVSLSSEDQTLITEIYFENKTATEIAHRDGVSISTVTRHANKAIRMLQKYYSEFGNK